MGTKKTKKVLIALDYDPTAQKVAEKGFSIAKEMKAEVILLHVITDPENYTSSEHITIMGFAGYMDTSALQSVGVDGLKKLSRQYLDKSKHHLGDKTIRTKIGEGDISDSILKVAKELKADFIIMGSHSRKSQKFAIIGNVTGKVLHYTPIPLIIIPTKD